MNSHIIKEGTSLVLDRFQPAVIYSFHRSHPSAPTTGKESPHVTGIHASATTIGGEVPHIASPSFVSYRQEIPYEP